MADFDQTQRVTAIKDGTRVLVYGTLGGPICGERVCNERVLAWLISDASVTSVSAVNSGIDSGAFNTGQFTFGKALAAMRATFRAIVQSRGVDLVYMTPGLTSFGLLRFSFVAIAARLMRKKVVCHFHGARLYQHLAGNPLKAYFRWWLSACDRLIFLSEGLKEQAFPLLPREKCTVVPNCIEDAWLQQEDRIEVTKRASSMLYLSNYIPEKGPADAIDAAQHLGNTTIDLYGSGPEAMLRHLRTMAGDNPNIRVHPPVYGEDKKQAFAAADYFVFPSRYPQEAFPLVVIEALSQGCIVVSYRAGAVPEMIEHGLSGILVDANPEALIDAISKLEADPGRKAELRHAAMARAAYYSESRVRHVFLRTLLSPFAKAPQHAISRLTTSVFKR